MKKIVRLTESELKNIVEASVRRAIEEGAIDEGKFGDAAKKVGRAVKSGVKSAAITGAIVGSTVAGHEALNKGNNDDHTRDKNAKKVEMQMKKTPKTMTKGDIATGKFNIETDDDDIKESRIRGAVMESINKLINGEL
jgi:hypothetical protein